MEAIIVCFPSCSHSLSLSWQCCCSQRHVYRPDFQALKKVQLALELCFAAKRPESDGQLWNAVSHHTEDPGGRQRETPQKQLEVRWLFHVFISQRWSINLDWHSLEYILCVLVCVCVCVCMRVSFKEKEGQGQGTVCLFSWRAFHLNWQCWLQYIISFSIPV